MYTDVIINLVGGFLDQFLKTNNEITSYQYNDVIYMIYTCLWWIFLVPFLGHFITGVLAFLLKKLIYLPQNKDISNNLKGWCGILPTIQVFLLKILIDTSLDILESVVNAFHRLIIVLLNTTRECLVFIILFPITLVGKIKTLLTRRICGDNSERTNAPEINVSSDSEGDICIRNEEDEYWESVWKKVPSELIDERPLVRELQFRINTPWKPAKKDYPPQIDDNRDANIDKEKQKQIQPCEKYIEPEKNVHDELTFEESLQIAIMNSLETVAQEEENRIASIEREHQSTLDENHTSCSSETITTKSDMTEQEFNKSTPIVKDGSDTDLKHSLLESGIIWKVLLVGTTGIFLYKRFIR